MLLITESSLQSPGGILFKVQQVLKQRNQHNGILVIGKNKPQHRGLGEGQLVSSGVTGASLHTAPDSLIQPSAAPTIPGMAAVPSAATRRAGLLVVSQKQLRSLYANTLCVCLQR